MYAAPEPEPSSSSEAAETAIYLSFTAIAKSPNWSLAAPSEAVILTSLFPSNVI